MFKGAYLKFQLRKAAWLALMTGLTAYTLLHVTSRPGILFGVFSGILVSELSIILLTPLFKIAVSLLAFLLLIIEPSFTLSYFATIIGMTAYTDFSNRKSKEVQKYFHLMGEDPLSDETEELAIIKKLEDKTKITINEKFVFEVDEKKFPPTAAASSILHMNLLFFYDNILNAPFGKREKKGIIAHEFGHLHHRDDFQITLINFLFWNTCLFSFMTFNLPLALALTFASSFAYYGYIQNIELLADLFASQYAKPQSISSALDIKQQKSKISKENEKRSFNNYPNLLLTFLRKKTGLVSHPSNKIRKSYLINYEEEKRKLKV